MACFGSLHGFAMGQAAGNPWGDAVTLLETTSSTPFFFNFHQGDVGHTTVFGPTGSGKTVLMSFLINQAYRVNPDLKGFPCPGCKTKGRHQPALGYFCSRGATCPGGFPWQMAGTGVTAPASGGWFS